MTREIEHRLQRARCPTRTFPITARTRTVSASNKAKVADPLTGSNTAPLLPHGWWLPSAFAIVAVLLLLVVPAVIYTKISNIRGDLVSTVEHARVQLNNLEASFASQLLVRNGALSANDIPDFATRAKLSADQAALGAAMRELGPEAVEHYSKLNGRLTAWEATAHSDNVAAAQEGLALLASADGLDSLLTTMSDARRAEVRRLERIDVVTPAFLAPVALIAIIIVMRAGRRTQRFARLAEEERAQVVRAGEARAALLRGVTHDVKNPLGAAAGYAQLLEEGVVGPVPAQQLEMVRRIHRLVRAAVLTIEDLLELARVDGNLQIEYATTDLATIVGEVVDDHRGMAQERGVAVGIDALPTPLVTDPQRVRQILANLVTNAIKYTPPGSDIRVSIVSAPPTAGREEVLGVEVRDNGPGIPPELHTKLFEEFFRVRAGGAGVAKGNGLGLAISRRIARLLGGDVTFAAASGGGAVFTLWLASSRTSRSSPPRG